MWCTQWWESSGLQPARLGLRLGLRFLQDTGDCGKAARWPTVDREMMEMALIHTGQGLWDGAKSGSVPSPLGGWGSGWKGTKFKSTYVEDREAGMEGCQTPNTRPRQRPALGILAPSMDEWPPFAPLCERRRSFER